jgi:hypothetical protein
MKNVQCRRRYRVGNPPRLSAKPNVASWSVINAIMSAYGGAEYDDLAAAVSQHAHPAGGRAFVDYCIRNGWLERE